VEFTFTRWNSESRYRDPDFGSSRLRAPPLCPPDRISSLGDFLFERNLKKRKKKQGNMRGIGRHRSSRWRVRAILRERARADRNFTLTRTQGRGEGGVKHEVKREDGGRKEEKRGKGQVSVSLTTFSYSSQLAAFPARARALARSRTRFLR